VSKTLFDWLEWLDDTDYAEWVRESLWGWPTALSVHAFGNGAVIGLTFIITLRLLGFFRTIPYTSLPYLFPIIWIAVVCQVFSGFTLWMTKPAKYVGAGMFDVKFSFVIIGVILTIIFNNIIRKEAASWEAKKAVSRRALVLAGLCSLTWAGVLTTGRLTAYLGTLYS
jgi:hypothetical protein